MGKTNIAWADYSWNPIRARNKETRAVGWHCTHVTEACRNCYAEKFNQRRGTGLEYKPGNLNKVALFLDENMMGDPARWKKPGKIFVCSMTDLFGDFVERAWQDRIFDVAEKCPQHILQILTKRPLAQLEYICNRYGEKGPPANVWLGTSIAENHEAGEFLSALVNTPAAMRWVSAEPLLEYVDMRPWLRKIGWVVVGGESGSKRMMPHDAARRVLADCREFGTAFFAKQLSEVEGRDTFKVLEHFPADLQVREFPQ